MIDVISFTDEKDAKLGAYFKNSEKSLSDNIESLENVRVFKSVNSDTCTMQSVNQLMSSVDDRCICAVYTHGNPGAFVANGKSYINDANSFRFKETFVYSTACSTAKSIGKKLISDGCLAFVGFDGDSQVLCDSDSANVIMNCDQACLFAFLNDDISLKEAVNLAIDYYNMQIAKCMNTSDILLRSILVANREALCVYGDQTLTRSDFNH